MTNGAGMDGSTKSSGSRNVRQSQMGSSPSMPPLLASCKHLVRPSGTIVGSEIAGAIKDAYPTLMSSIPPLPCSGPAFLASIDGRLPLRHSQVQTYLKEFGETLHSLGIGRGHRVALVLPNGPELALAILAVSQWAACVPLSATGAVAELSADLQRCGADLVIGPYSDGPLPIIKSAGAPNERAASSQYANASLSGFAKTTAVMENAVRDWTVHHHVQEAANELGIPFCGLVPDPQVAGPFRLVAPAKKQTRSKLRRGPLNYDALSIHPTESKIVPSTKTTDSNLFQPNSGHDESLVLFTSGTTGNKKLVPHRMGDILVAATTIALSWELSPTDVNCNLMPLFHVGGIIRQVYSPLLSGGCVICCPSFDADLFWALLERKAFNWYYAAPTMHQIILQIGKALLGDKVSSFKLKMIANAAGGLLPSLAKELRSTFKAAVLPSYGMTEAMPISSPPANYDLSKPGTSGVPVGPEVAILNLATFESLPPDEEGPICVRGAPSFRGYGVLANDPDAPQPESFMKDGWFNTGDLGFLDSDGYLYITGRAKEVINRGGEIISPMEVEEAIISHPDVRLCAAFSAAHDILQETVGIVIVPEPGRTRSLDLSALHAFIADKLATPKWPQCLIFMEGGLPKSHTNKLLRVKLGSRLGLPEFSDAMSPWARTFEAQCPKQGTPLTTSIPSKPVAIDPKKVQRTLRDCMGTDAITIVPYPNRPGALVAYVGENDVDRLKLIETALKNLHRYEVPSHICLLKSTDTPSIKHLSKISPTPQDAVASLLTSSAAGSEEQYSDPIVQQVQDMFLELLNLDYIPSPDADFFHIGGNSMRASQLASKVRRTFGISCTGAEIFHHGKCSELAGLVRARSEVINGSTQGDGENQEESNRDDHGAPFSSEHIPPSGSIWGAIFQLVPVFVVFPAWQISRYLLFFLVLLEKSRFIHSWLPQVSDRSFATFLVAYFIFHMVWVTLAPLIFVLIKWSVIGRYKEGRYPIWGSYYLRWWFVDVCRKLFLRGLWGSSDITLRWYYQLLGARIEPGARISLDCDLAEYDLVTIGKNAAVELSTVRGFGVSNGAMILGPVRVGRNASVGMRSVVAPYTSVPDERHLGPATSTYDKEAFQPKFARVNRQRFPEPMLATQVCVGMPILFVVDLAAQIPPMIVLYSLLWFKSRETSDIFFSNWNELIDWLCDPRRIPFFFGIRLARALLSPFFYMMAAIIVKWTFIGTIKPGKRSIRSEQRNLKMWLSGALFTRKRMQSVTDLIGRHYENVSVLYRLLGAKVGKRVFWPGNQPIVNGLFDLLEIGDDAVFGSRSTLLCASVDRCDKIVLCAGANVSDNCVVLPGTVVGKNAVLGSNSISREGAYLPSGSVWFGSAGAESACLESGDGTDADYYRPLADEAAEGSRRATEYLNAGQLPMIGDESTLRPFGRAVYLGQAKGYTVLPIPVMVAYTWLVRIVSSAFHTLPLLGAVHFGAVLLYSDHVFRRSYRRFVWGEDYEEPEFDEDSNHDHFLWFTRNFDNDGHHHTYPQVFFALLTCFLVTHFLRVVGCLAIELTAKWCIMGRRQPGRYNYDTHDYAQRWELYQLTAKIRKISRLNILQFISGTPFMNWYFRKNGGNVGKDCCLYPSGADPFMPEPDLVTIGEGTVVDCASIVCHLNTRGSFQLAPIVIGKHCTLRTRSRLQQGVHMEEGSELLEKSIAMTGEVIDGKSVWQGGPASLWFRLRDHQDDAYLPPQLGVISSASDIELVHV